MPIDPYVETLFSYGREPRAPWFVRLWIAGLFLSGAFAWAYFFGWASVDLDFHDWADINVPRLMFLQNALAAGELPLHMADVAPLHGVTDRFFALPDVITTPQTLLLLLVSVPAFVLIDVLIHYSIGMAGLLLLRRRFQWSLFTFSVVAILFTFNGHILSHYTVGHFTWGPYFLLPLVFLCLFRFLDGDHSWRLVLCFAAVMFYIVLAGGQHHATWVLLFIAFLIPCCGRRAWWLAAAGSAAVLLSAVRLLPPAIELRAFRDTGILTDVLGYPSVLHMVRSMVDLRRERIVDAGTLPANFWFFDHNYWEFNFYVGAIGLAIVAGFGVYAWLRSSPPRYPELIVPAFGVVALSLGSVFRIVRLSGIPVLDGERITSRMFSVPVVLLIIVAGIYLEKLLRDAPPARWQRVVGCGVLGLMALDISSSLRILRLGESKRLFGGGPLESAAGALANHVDAPYAAVLAAGFAITVVTAIVLGALSYRERRTVAGHH
jgi:hypothetical protein